MSEIANHRGSHQIALGLKLAAVMIGGALLLTLARHQGWITGDLVLRANNVIIGLALAAYGNVMPKMLAGSPPRSLQHAALAQAVARVGGWAMMMGFLVWCGLWACAPLPVAGIGATVAVVGGVAVMLGYTAWKCVSCHRSKSP